MNFSNFQKARNPYDVLNLPPSCLSVEDAEMAYRKERISLESKSRHLTPMEIKQNFEELERAFQEVIEIIEINAQQQNSDPNAALSVYLMPRSNTHSLLKNNSNLMSYENALNHDNSSHSNERPIMPKPMEFKRSIVGIKDQKTKDQLLKIINETPQVGGVLFKKLREEAKISLEEVSSHIKVNLSHLIALENEAYERLPAPVYVRGFISAYINYLGIQNRGEDIMEALLKTIKAKKKIFD
jgi:DNA-binding transcriptional regulator YiaG